MNTIGTLKRVDKEEDIFYEISMYREIINQKKQKIFDLYINFFRIGFALCVGWYLEDYLPELYSVQIALKIRIRFLRFV